MPAPVLLTMATAAARKAVAGLKGKFSTRRPAREAEVPERQHVELGGQRRDEPESPPAVSQSGHVTNQMSGTANKVLQAGDIRGGVRF